jgi:hypothetical protein
MSASTVHAAVNHIAAWFAITPLKNSAASFPATRRPLLQSPHRWVAVAFVVTNLGRGYRGPHSRVGLVTVSLRRSMVMWEYGTRHIPHAITTSS